MKPAVKTYPGRFTEIYEAGKGYRYTLLRPSTGGFDAYHGSTCCKDFFTDVFYAETLGKNTSIHGFNWKPGLLPAGFKTLHMACGFEGQDLTGHAAKAMKLLNQWEERWHLPLTKVSSDVTGKILIFSFNKAWTERPVLISFLTLLMRIAPGYDGDMDPVEFFRKIIAHGNPYGHYEKSELGRKGLIEKIEKLWIDRTLPDPSQTYAQYEFASSAHHRGGFIAHLMGVSTG